MRRNFLIIAVIVVLVAVGAGYYMVDRAADDSLRQSLEEAAADLPEDSRLTYERADANILRDSAVVEGLRVSREDAEAGLLELRVDNAVLSGFSDNAEATLEHAKLQGVHFSALSPEGETVDVMAETLSVRELATAALLAILQDLRGGVSVDRATLGSLRLESLTVEGIALTAPGTTLEISSLSIDDMGARVTEALSLRDMKLTLLETAGNGADAQAGDEEAEEDAEPESLHIAMGAFRSEKLDHIALIESLEGEGFGVINELAGPFAANTELSDVSVTMGELRFGYASFQGTFEDMDERQVAEGSMSDFVFEVRDGGEDAEEMFADLKELGYAKPRFSASWNVVFEQSEPLIRMQPFTFSLEDGGDLNLRLVLTPPEQVENLRDLAQMEGYEGFAMHEVALEFVNAGLFQRMLGQKAKEDGVSEEAARGDLVRQVDRQFEDHPKIAEALKTFLADPRRISIEAKLPRAVPMEMFAMAMLVQPRAIVENAEVTVSAN